MTYCVAINVEEGLVLLSDTRTNAGMDNISRFTKMFTWEVPGERAIALMTAGNLSITQSIIARLGEDLNRDQSGDPAETILNAPTLYRAAELVGQRMREEQTTNGDAIEARGASAGASIILAGQRRGGVPRVFLIYSAGNFIETTRDTSFFQIGEHKYGKPILDRMVHPKLSLQDAVKSALVSMDSTIQSNLSVGMPLDLALIPRDHYGFSLRRRIAPGDSDYLRLSLGWSDSLRQAFTELPEYPIL